MNNEYRIISDSLRGNFPFLNLEIVGNSNVATNFNLLPNELNFCCGNYSREDTIQGPKQCGEKCYLIFETSASKLSKSAKKRHFLNRTRNGKVGALYFRWNFFFSCFYQKYKNSFNLEHFEKVCFRTHRII